MKIKDGYNGKETTLKISSTTHGGLQLWIRQEGISDQETLSYLTATEGYELFKEIKDACKSMFE